MRKIIPYIAFTSLTCLSLMNVVPAMAGGCSSNINKNLKIECPEDDIDCQTNRVEKYQSDKAIKS